MQVFETTGVVVSPTLIEVDDPLPVPPKTRVRLTIQFEVETPGPTSELETAGTKHDVIED